MQTIRSTATSIHGFVRSGEKAPGQANGTLDVAFDKDAGTGWV
jgi:hypothetical protein